uniref:Uncharacterized protein n=1 Tax=Ditylenchus dipsaci TaxID=166011 RepID=A0A915DFS2_9BILA
MATYKSLSVSSSFVFKTFHVQTLDDCWLPVPIARNIYFNDLRSTIFKILKTVCTLLEVGESMGLGVHEEAM